MTLKVLAIDDSRTMRDLLQVSLTESGFDITLAEDGIDGLLHVADRRGHLNRPTRSSEQCESDDHRSQPLPWRSFQTLVNRSDQPCSQDCRRLGPPPRLQLSPLESVHPTPNAVNRTALAESRHPLL